MSRFEILDDVRFGLESATLTPAYPSTAAEELLVWKDWCEQLLALVELQDAQLSNIEEYGTKEINAAVTLRQDLAKSRMSLDHLATVCEKYRTDLLILQNELRELKCHRKQMQH